MNETITPIDHDKREWGSGPWNDEPDRVDFIHAGYACLLLRNRMGAWCGYVGVPERHPAFRKPYDDVDVSVHGGLTYSDTCSPPICHVPEPGMPDRVWWLGFDCAHAGDFTPSSNRFWGTGYPFPDHKYDHVTAIAADPVGYHTDRYRTVDYARSETEQLAEQLRRTEEGQ